MVPFSGDTSYMNMQVILCTTYHVLLPDSRLAYPDYFISSADYCKSSKMDPFFSPPGMLCITKAHNNQ